MPLACFRFRRELDFTWRGFALVDWQLAELPHHGQTPCLCISVQILPHRLQCPCALLLSPFCGAGAVIAVTIRLTSLCVYLPSWASVQVGLFAIQLLKCSRSKTCFQLHHHTKSAFEIFQALAKLSSPLPLPTKLKNKTVLKDGEEYSSKQSLTA